MPVHATVVVPADGLCVGGSGVHVEHRSSRAGRVRETRPARLLRSGWVTGVVLVVLLLGFGVAWHLHQRARFHQLTATAIPETVSAPMPGGQEGIVLSRVALLNDFEPEFVSATVVPGIGMQLLQADVASPGSGTTSLLAGQSLSDAARVDPHQVMVAPLQLRVSTRHLQDANAGEDVLGITSAASVAKQTLVDGGEATGSFESASTGMKTAVQVTLAGRAIDIVVRATNTAGAYRYVSLQWSPNFVAPQGDLGQLALAVPAKTSASGRVPSNFALPDGGSLGPANLDVNLTSMPRDVLGDGTVVRLLNQAGKYQLRFTGMGQTLRSMHVTNDTGAHTARLTFSSLDQTAEPELRDQVVRPGATMQWHMHVEIQPLKYPSAMGDGTASSNNTAPDITPNTTQ